MAYSRLLLLLIGVISSHLPEVQAKPIDFWCHYQCRKNMEKRTIEDLKTKMVDCVGSDTLSSPVHLPCVGVNTAEWANRTLQQKFADVVAALQMFQDGVKGARNQTVLPCQTRLFETLERDITNYLAIVNRCRHSDIQIQSDVVTPSHSAVENCSSQTSLNKVLDHLGKLLKGKLERLAIDLEDSICKVTQNIQ